MRPKSQIYTPKRDDQHPHPFHMRSPLPPGSVITKTLFIEVCLADRLSDKKQHDGLICKQEIWLMCDCLHRRVKSFSFTTNHKAMGENFKFSIIFIVFFLLKGLREVLHRESGFHRDDCVRRQ